MKKILTTIYLGEKFCHVIKEIGAIEITVIVQIQFRHQSGDPPQLYNKIKSDFPVIISYLHAVRDYQITQPQQVALQKCTTNGQLLTLIIFNIIKAEMS